MLMTLIFRALSSIINLKFLSCLIALFLIFSGTPVNADHFRIRDCPDNALVDLNWAADFIDRHLDMILQQQTVLNTRYQQSIKHDWPRTTIDCANPNRSSCRDDANAFHVSANIVHPCWGNIMSRTPRWTRCRLVGTILHEKAHEARVPDADPHNEGPSNPEANNDPVYRFGEFVGNYCTTVAGTAAPGSLDRQGLLNIGSSADLPLGDYCDRDDQCRSNECRQGRCVCNDNGDCPSGHICDKVGKNECIRAQLPLGAGCERNAQCLSDQCRRGICVCDDDGDCPSGFRCKTAGINECIRINGQIGEVCNRNSDCITGKCDRDICVCDTDQHCIDFFGGTDWRCRKLGQNECMRTRRDNGARCHLDEDCLSGQCFGAGDSRTCRPTGLPNGARCHRNDDCVSGQCRGVGDGRTCR